MQGNESRSALALRPCTFGHSLSLVCERSLKLDLSTSKAHPSQFWREFDQEGYLAPKEHLVTTI